MFKKIQLIVIILLSVFIVVGIMSYIGKGKELDHLKQEKSQIKIPEKQVVSKQFTQDDVKKYENLVKQKLQNFQQHDLKEGEFNENNSGVMTVKFLFSPPGGKIITEKDSVKDYVKYYSSFDYKISDVTAKPDGSNGAEVYFKVNVKQDKNDVNPQYELARLQFNENDELVGGSLYEKQK
ncbi:TPA: hypothetical protein PD879_002507 [Staphylococcus aureus]|uniref:hypothetical protein n=1 Tax=Staphylococcus aureus TaxID=1280 RepID=UPI0028BBA131|nr:hypothetical protein [Staphylococcus aureus]HDE9869384.1 hypothetical protein [Staphylococcus aureus]HDF4675577.1 hypothetical protein [Staphylococcus aureus]HDH1976590.1 hypothetical protein [Staphylococcus aureus]HDY5190171.1 hypothetical protein [Staphylococcus aureus]